ncbi:NAD(+)/NADH kinase [Nocardioides acrostichi]|uniref:NAD(+)/NADH kinase n=1 Tax=Nocardioides acrostichi TaxID=2784339 RepID=A0A930Y979_9ACTN|nr:NAD(+)/NADH kinase [Nocardioides acrostichi]MBF4163836.1 NAD(+)/NADH kinase [Nocardioides acrostichi]
MTLAPRVVVVHRTTERDGLLATHGSAGQAAFFLRTRGRDLVEVEARDAAQRSALAVVEAAIPRGWRQGRVERADLPRFRFAPEDVVVVVGQDGLVANVARYLDGNPVIGVDPDPGRNAGVLVRHAPAEVEELLPAVVAGRAPVERRAMVRAEADDGQRLDALNEIYLGHETHQTARWTLVEPDGARERQASSGLLVTTGTGATGWCRSVSRERGDTMPLPAATQRGLAWFVREAWPSPVTGVEHTAGMLGPGAGLEEGIAVVVESDRLVAFGDGIESDRLTLTWGQRVRVSESPRVLLLV